MSNLIEQPRFSCALAAQQTVLAIPRGIPIIHAGPGCSSKAFNFTSYSLGFQGEGYAGGAHISATNAGESEVVFGGEAKLHNTIDGALRVLDGDLYVALTGCTAGIIGDDVYAVTRKFAEQGKPVVGVETAGFRGNNYFGHELVIEAIMNQYIGDVTPKVEKGLVNVWTSVPYQDPYWRGDLNEIKRILEGIGLKVNILFGEGSEGVSEWKNIPNAEANILISPWVGLKTVRLLEKKYCTPFLHYPILPVGGEETSKFLRKVSEYMELDREQTEKFIEKEENRFYSYFTSLTDFFGEYKNNLPSELYVVGDALYGLGISNFVLNELGFISKGVYITDDPALEHHKQLKEYYDAFVEEEYKGLLKIEADGGLIERDIREKIGKSHKAVILGSQWEKLLADETQNLGIFISAPANNSVILNKTFVGYNGGLTLVETIYDSVFARKNTTSRTQLFAREEE